MSDLTTKDYVVEFIKAFKAVEDELFQIFCHAAGPLGRMKLVYL